MNIQELLQQFTEAVNESKRLTADYRAAQADLRAAKAELQAAQADVPRVVSLHYESNQANLLLEHEAVAYLAADIAGLFDDAGAINYVELEMRDQQSGRTFIFTAQLKDGLTPHQKEVAANKRAEKAIKELHAMQAAMAALEAEMEDLRSNQGI